MPRQCTFTVRCSTAWWLRPCLSVLKGWVLITHRMPSDELLERIVHRAVRTELVKTNVES